MRLELLIRRVQLLIAHRQRLEQSLLLAHFLRERGVLLGSAAVSS